MEEIANPPLVAPFSTMRGPFKRQVYERVVAEFAKFVLA
jgi:hypothetical protein